MIASTPPLIRLSSVHHVGRMDPTLKRNDSYESSGLSVSLHPGAWRRIGRGLVDGPCWTLRREDGSFLDAHGMTRRMRTEVLAWGLDHGYATEGDLWRFSYFDDELECRVSQTFASRQEAREEADGMAGVRRIVGHSSTPKLDLCCGQSRPTQGDAGVLDLLLPIWAHERHGLDGVWWEDRLDVACHSAPRGVIVVDMLAGWSVTADAVDPGHEDADEEDDDDDDA